MFKVHFLPIFKHKISGFWPMAESKTSFSLLIELHAKNPEIPGYDLLRHYVNFFRDNEMCK